MLPKSGSNSRQTCTSKLTLMRTLEGLSNIRGDAKYHKAAMQAIKYMSEHLRVPNGLLYWEQETAYDALRKEKS